MDSEDREEARVDGRWTKADGDAAVARWRASGLSQAAWCRAHGVPVHRLQYWASRETRAGDPADGCGFVPVMCGPPRAGTLTIWTGSSVRVEVGAGFDPAVLRAVVEALR